MSNIISSEYSSLSNSEVSPQDLSSKVTVWKERPSKELMASDLTYIFCSLKKFNVFKNLSTLDYHLVEQQNESIKEGEQKNDSMLEQTHLYVSPVRKIFFTLSNQKPLIETYRQSTTKKNFQSFNLKNKKKIYWRPDLMFSQKIFFHHCLELFNQQKVSDNSQVHRMLVLEMERIKNHLSTVCEICFHLGDDQFLNLTKQWLSLFDQFIKMFSFNCFEDKKTSAVKRCTAKDYQTLKSSLVSLNTFFKIIEKSVLSSNVSKDLLNRNFLGRSDVMNNSLSGICLRSAGWKYDIRKVHPYYFYNQIEFEVPLGHYGGCLDRFYCYIEEAIQSIHIANQLLNYIPSLESYTNHYSVRPDHHLFYSSFEFPNGEMGVFQYEKDFGLRLPSHFIGNFLQKNSSNVVNSELILFLLTSGFHPMEFSAC
jgi:hypothetical protein